MLKPLRRKLALAYTLLAGLVLALVAFACLRTAENQLQHAAETAFDSGVNTIIYKLQSEHTLVQSWLAQMEADSRQIIHIEDGGEPLAFHGAWVPATDRNTLVELANAHADEMGLFQSLGSLEPTSVSFQMSGGSGDNYRARVTLIPDVSNPLRVTILRDMAPEDARIWQQRRSVLLLVCVGLTLLAVSGWLYSGRAVRPAEESHKKQVEFIAAASHELKAPLAVISASADAILGGGEDPLLRNIKSESLSMARLVDDLLLLTRADAGTWSIRRAPIDMDTLLIECYELFQPVARANDIMLDIELPDAPLPSVHGDAERLKQVVSILLDNALTYTLPSGHVSMRALVKTHLLHVEISDDGPGVPDPEKTRIFDRFYRIQTSHTDRNHVGLGLPIARELVQSHGGRIRVEDAIPHGARFILELPTTRNT